MGAKVEFEIYAGSRSIKCWKSEMMLGLLAGRTSKNKGGNEKGGEGEGGGRNSFAILLSRARSILVPLNADNRERRVVRFLDNLETDFRFPWCVCD